MWTGKTNETLKAGLSESSLGLDYAVPKLSYVSDEALGLQI